MDKVKKKEIDLDDTALGWLVDVQKWEHEAVTSNKILKQLSNIHDAAEDLNRKFEDTCNKNGTTTLPYIRNVDKTWRSDVEGNRDVTVIANKAAI